jgi:hypothetical protein
MLLNPQVQIWNYYLFPNIVELAKYPDTQSSDDRSTKILDLLRIALDAMNNAANPDELFSACTGGALPKSTARTCIKNVLAITYKTRKYFTDELGINFKGDDVNYALCVCFLRQSKFDINPVHTSQESPWINLLSYLCSTYYFDKLDIDG